MEKKLMVWVFPGVLLTLASPLRFRRELINEDFPTFDRPMNAISGTISFGQPSPSDTSPLPHNLSYIPPNVFLSFGGVSHLQFFPISFWVLDSIQVSYSLGRG
jgi:hypothetical protein